MASVIIVENEFKDSVKELTQIVNAVEQNTEYSDKVRTYFDDDKITDKPALIQAVYEASSPSRLTKLSDKEFEPTFNLIIYLLSELEGDFSKVLGSESVLLKNLIASTPTTKPSLRDRTAIKHTTIISVLNTIFNFLPETSPSRIFVIEQILDVVQTGKLEFKLIQHSIGHHLEAWLDKAGASEQQIRLLFWKFVQLDEVSSEQTLLLIKRFTSKHGVDKQELTQLIRVAFASEIVDVSFLVNTNVAKALEENASDDLVATFNKYIRGELISSADEQVVHKSKILALTRFFVDADDDKSVFKYSEIPGDITKGSSFEELLITAIKAGLIEGKLNQIEETFYLTRANRFIIVGDSTSINSHLEHVRKTLQGWKVALDNLDEIVKTSREEIVNLNEEEPVYEEDE